MSDDSFQLPVRKVLSYYPAHLQPRMIAYLGNRGGFSGARLWRVQCQLGDVCLRAWPAHVTRESLTSQHEWMRQARAAGLTFVPLVHTSLAGTTWLELEGQLWEAESWLEGKADFMANQSAERLRAACVVLARLHESWKSERTASASCPGVRRRLQRSSEWQSLLASGWRPAANVGQPLQSLVQRATL